MRRHVAADFGRRILPVAQRPTHVHTPAARTHHECTAPHNSEQYRGTSCAIFGQFSHASTARVSKFTRRSISVQFRKLYRAGTVPPQLIVCVTKFTRASISVHLPYFKARQARVWPCAGRARQNRRRRGAPRTSALHLGSARCGTAGTYSGGPTWQTRAQTNSKSGTLLESVGRRGLV